MEKQMEMDKAQFAEQLKNLVELGKKKKNVLEYQEINDFFKGITLNNEQMDLIFEYLEANGVDVLRVTEDDALLDNEDMHMEEDEVDLENIDLSVPEGVSIEDPVRMYLKEIGKQLIPDKHRIGQICMHQFHRFQIIFAGRLMCILDIMHLHSSVEHLHTLQLIVRQQTAGKTKLFQMRK